MCGSQLISAAFTFDIETFHLVSKYQIRVIDAHTSMVGRWLVRILFVERTTSTVLMRLKSYFVICYLHEVQCQTIVIGTPWRFFSEIFSERTEMAELLRLRQYSCLVIPVLQSCVSLNLVLIGGGEWFTVSDQALD